MSIGILLEDVETHKYFLDMGKENTETRENTGIRNLIKRNLKEKDQEVDLQVRAHILLVLLQEGNLRKNIKNIESIKAVVLDHPRPHHLDQVEVLVFLKFKTLKRQ